MNAAFDAIGLDIAYRASASPQLVDIAVELAEPAEVPLVPWTIGELAACIRRGLAGGAEFSPAAGSATLEAGPTGEGEPGPGELGPRYAFRLSVVGVSPRFLRVIVEQLASCGGSSRVRSISIVGALPPDGSALSVRDGEIRGWLADPTAYPKAWGDPGFSVARRSIPRGATLHVVLARPDEVAFTELEETFSAWQSAVLAYPNAARSGRGLMDPHGVFARGRSDFHAKVGLFDHSRGPAGDALVNALARFHATVAPLASATIAMP